MQGLFLYTVLLFQSPVLYMDASRKAGAKVGRKSKSITQKQIEVLSARVNFDTYKRIETIAKKEDLSMTQIVRAAIREYLENHNRAERAA